jgi:hypothetical protein
LFEVTGVQTCALPIFNFLFAVSADRIDLEIGTDVKRDVVYVAFASGILSEPEIESFFPQFFGDQRQDGRHGMILYNIRADVFRASRRVVRYSKHKGMDKIMVVRGRGLKIDRQEGKSCPGGEVTTDDSIFSLLALEWMWKILSARKKLSNRRQRKIDRYRSYGTSKCCKSCTVWRLGTSDFSEVF